MTPTDLREDLQHTLGDAYRIERELTPGGMSRLFLATERSLDRRVVIKLLPPEYASEVSAARFQREITVTAHLQHPHILPILSAGSKDGLLYYIMPYVEGESLRHRLAREGRLPVADAVRILREVADALARAHRAGIVHRDIKPENILLQDDHALLADFGVARALFQATGGERLTETGMGIGTPGYMAPEQLAGDRHVDSRADVYALAVVGYEMLAGTPPFAGATPQAVAAAHFTAPPKPLAQLRPEVSAAVSHAIAHALAKEPSERFASASDFRDALAAGDQTATRKRYGRRWAAGALLGVIVIGAGYQMWRASHGAISTDANGAIRIAVLPFDNLGDTSDEYFADGVTDAVRGKLTAVPDLEVTAPLSSAQYRHTNKSPQQVGRELGVQYLLTGRVRWAKAAGAASRVQVNPALIDATTAADKWEASFDAPLTDVFQVQADIATRVVNQLRVAITPSTERMIATQPTHNLDAYDAFLRGQAIEAAHPSYDSSAAVAFAQAVRLDSTFALAWAALANAYVHGIVQGVPKAVEHLEAARRAAQRALTLAPDLAEAHGAQAGYYAAAFEDIQRALAELQTGVRLDPSNAVLLRWAAFFEWEDGLYDSSLVHRERASQLDPRNAEVLMGLCDGYRGFERYGDAERACDRAMALQPTNVALVNRRVFVSLEQGDLAGARAVLRSALGTIDSASLAGYVAENSDLGWVLDSSLERVLLKQAKSPTTPDDRADWLFTLAEQYGYRGDSARARAYADSARVEYATALRTESTGKQTVPPVTLATQHVYYGLSLAYLGRGDSALAHARLAETLEAEWIFKFDRAKVYLLLNQPKNALDLVELIVTQPNPRQPSPGWLPYRAQYDLQEPVLTRAYVRLDRNFARLHGNPRFDRLVGITTDSRSLTGQQ